MTANTAMRGEKIYDMELDLAGVTDYGVSMDAILAGQEAIPLHGARFDLAVAGRYEGRLAGRAHGIDYLRVRADGRIELDLHLDKRAHRPSEKKRIADPTKRCNHHRRIVAVCCPELGESSSDRGLVDRKSPPHCPSPSMMNPLPYGLGQLPGETGSYWT
jgi:hypothetical protein